MTLIKRSVYIVLFLSGLLVSFQNCGRSFLLLPMTDTDVLNQSLMCGVDLRAIFESEIHPFLVRQCSQCHVEGGPGIGHFAERDRQKAWLHFNNIGIIAISRNAVNNNHKPPYTGSNNRQEVDNFNRSWNDAHKVIAACSAQNEPSNAQLNLNNGISLTSSPVTIDGISNTWRNVQWRLLSDVDDSRLKEKIPVEFQIQIRSGQLGNGRSLEFQNPMIRVVADISFYFDHLRLIINGNVLRDLTRYTQVHNSFSSNQWTPIINNSFASVPFNEPLNQIYVQVLFEGAKLVNKDSTNQDSQSPQQPGGSSPPANPSQNPPESVTYADLMGNNPNLNVFRQFCLNCHRNGNAQGGLNLEDATRTRSLAQTILSRMRNPNRPMPPQGLLDSRYVMIVERWVMGGAR